MTDLKNAFAAMQNCTYRAERLMPVISALTKCPDWFVPIAGPHSLMQLQVALKENARCVQLFDTPIQALTNAVNGLIPAQVADPVLREVLQSMQNQIGRMASQQLAMQQEIVQDQLEFLQEQICANLSRSAESYKSSLKEYLVQLF
jgi:hypothetical protein